jgi:hypothetical protein
MSDTRYAVYCKGCGHIEDKAWEPATADEHSKRSTRPLTSSGHVPIYCQKCGNRNWQRPATKEQIESYDAAQRREVRAVELTQRDDFDGLFKVPDEIRAAPEVKRALGNLLAPLDGEVLKNAKENVMKVARSGMAADSLTWIEYYDRAVQRAVAGGTPKSKAAA